MPLISFEGPDKYGKSTQISLLYEYLTALSLPVTQVRQPGGIVRTTLSDPPLLIGESLRQLAIEHANDAIGPHLFAASFRSAQQLEYRTNWVLMDRWIDSCLVYQGEKVRPLLQGIPIPSTTFLLVGNVYRRLDTDDVQVNGVISATQRLAQYYRLMQYDPERWVILNAKESIESIHAQVCDAIARRYGISDEPDFAEQMRAERRIQDAGY